MVSELFNYNALLNRDETPQGEQAGEEMQSNTEGENVGVVTMPDLASPGGQQSNAEGENVGSISSHLVEHGSKLQAKGDLKGAEREYLKALDLADEQKIGNMLIAVLIEHGQKLRAQDELRGAEREYLKALKLARKYPEQKARIKDQLLEVIEDKREHAGNAERWAGELEETAGNGFDLPETCNLRRLASKMRTDAMTLYQECLDLAHAELSLRLPVVFAIQFDLARAQYLLAKSKRVHAEAKERRAKKLQADLRQSGLKDEDTRKVVHNLRTQSQRMLQRSAKPHGQAREMYQKLYLVARTIPGLEDFACDANHNLAMIASEEGNYQESETLLQRVLETREAFVEKVTECNALYNRAKLFLEEVVNDKAEGLFKRVSEMRASLGHPIDDPAKSTVLDVSPYTSKVIEACKVLMRFYWKRGNHQAYNIFASRVEAAGEPNYTYDHAGRQLNLL